MSGRKKPFLPKQGVREHYGLVNVVARLLLADYGTDEDPVGSRG